MDRLLNELEEYLSSNTIQYSLDKENYTVSFEGKSYEVFEPNEDGYFFSEDFRWDCERTEEDGYIFRLGGVWYTLDKGKENEPKLNRVKWRGQSEMAGLSTNFLGVHGSFELLNGTGLYPDWVKKAKFLGIERLGIVEKATLAGALKFQNACKAEGIVPVFGLEVPVKDEKKDITYTYKVYAKNEKGWQHLLALNKVLNCGDNGKFVSPKDMSEHVSDVYIVFDPKTIQFEDVPILLRNKPNVFWQVDTVKYTKNDRDTSYLMNFEQFYKSKMKPVAICDAYYIEPEYAILREVVNKIDGKVNYKSGNQYFKDEATYMEELLSLFGDSERGEEFYMVARSNADMIAKNCNFEIPTDSRHLPRYEMTKEEKKKYASNEDMFDSLIYEGLENKPELLEDYSEDVLVERIERESDVIKYGQVVDYFLILRDIVNWCKKNNILLGGGRGSSSGSLISYLFGLVNTNPLHFGLIFERFLNKGRVLSSLPDIDTDVPGEYRPAVKQYMENRFGASQVCSVGTYTTLQIKQAINDVGKIYGASIPTLRRLTKMIEDVKTEEDFLKLACKKSEVNQFLNKYPEMMNIVFLLLGQQKAASIHACAMMIFPKEKTMYEWCPVRKSGDLVVSEWEGGEMDEAGFLKEDILGIEQLDKFTDILNLIEKNTGRKINLYSDIEYDDPEVYRYFANGWLSDIFQFSAKGLCAYTQKLKPKNMDDVVAALSLFRPGPMENGFHMDYIALKNGEKEPEYPIGAEEILKNTYSVLVYQEQIMNICNQLAGFDLVTCDKVRKSLGKKKLDVLLPLKTKFIEGYVGKFGSKGVTEKNAEILWEQMEEFAKYSFNKCVSFSTLVYVVGFGEITVERLFHAFHNQECNSFVAKSMKKDGTLYFSKIKDVRYSGNRPVYEISLVDGKRIKTTGNHKFPTTEGKVYAEFLLGKTLFVANNSSNAQMANVVSVSLVGNEDVYDIEMEDENHNFVANGIVTCNSHAAAYAINAYNSLWLKVHYPLEFWSVALSRASEDDFPQYVNEMQQTEGIEIKPVNINKSDINIVADKKDNSIYWAINATKQVGEKAQNQIMEERSKNGEYFSLAEFIDRHTFKGSAVNKSVIENLIYSGAFDMMDETRGFSNIFSAREFMLGKYREKNKIKIDKEKDEYFLAFEKKKIAKNWWWLLQQKNKSGFAFFDYEGLVREYLKPKVRNGVFYNVEDLQNYDGSTYEMVMVGGYVLEVEEREGKKGRFANLLLESNYKFLRVVIFPDDYEENADFFISSKKSILLLSGKANFDKFKEEYVLQVNSNSKFIKLGV
jgi:DNA polymerase-3 subunit alpha|nr:MAG TPA: DNA polymerase III, alpha subunit [Caudoviricetes sp.]